MRDLVVAVTAALAPIGATAQQMIVGGLIERDQVASR
jgi:hypothetical protein